MYIVGGVDYIKLSIKTDPNWSRDGRRGMECYV